MTPCSPTALPHTSRPTGLRRLRKRFTAIVGAALLLVAGIHGADAALSRCSSQTNFIRSVPVSTASQLTAALTGAQPGDRIELADGTYTGAFVAAVPATSAKPITICGSSSAILEKGAVSSGYVLHLTNVDYYRLVGFTVTNGQKGIMLDTSTHCLLSSLLVHNIGMEGVHFRTNSKYNRLENSEIRQTGRFKADFGEGVYIGSAKSNLVGDNSDFNEVVGNRIGPDVTAESIDIKEYSSSGIITDNYFDGVGMSGKNFADSWLDVKGNGYYIARNTGKTTLLDGIQTHNVVNGWGSYNVFDANTLGVDANGFGIAQSSNSINLVRCNNVQTGAKSGLTNLPSPGCADTPLTTGTAPKVTTPNWPNWQSMTNTPSVTPPASTTGVPKPASVSSTAAAAPQPKVSSTAAGAPQPKASSTAAAAPQPKASSTAAAAPKPKPSSTAAAASQPKASSTGVAAPKPASSTGAAVKAPSSTGVRRSSTGAAASPTKLSSSAPAAPSVPSTPTVPTTPAPTVYTCASVCPGSRVVDARTTAALQTALANAAAGDCIQLFSGSYVAAAKDSFFLRKSGTALNHITVVGPADAVLKTADSSKAPTLVLSGVDYYDLLGFSVTQGLRGIVLEKSNHNLLRALRVYSTDREGIWINQNSGANTLFELEVRDTGAVKSSYGNAIVIGTPYVRGVAQDACTNNQVLYCRIGPNVAGESVMVNPFAVGGVIANNVLDGRGQSGRNNADSLINLSGNGFYVFNNTGALPIKDGIQVYASVEGWGSYNVFDQNRLLLQAPTGTGLLAARRTASIWRCNNFVRGGSLVTNLESCGDNPIELKRATDPALPTTPSWPAWQSISIPPGGIPASSLLGYTPIPDTASPSTPSTPSTPSPTNPTAPTTPTPTPTQPAPSPLPPVYSSQCSSWPATRVVQVSSTSSLQSALWNAQPGDRIDMAAGTYTGNHVITGKSGTATSRITLCGPREAILQAGTVKTGYVLHLLNVEYWNLVGFTVTNGQKGCILDGSSHNLLSSMLVYAVGMEAVHFRTNSKYNRIESSEIRQTGRFRPEYGEGVYIGSAKSNLVGDNSDFNEVVGNRIGPDVTAEGIDIKEYSSSGIITDNRFDGVGMSGKNYADSWIDVKGNGYYIARNVGKTTLLDGIQTHNVVNGWGSYNVFDANTLEVNAPGFGISTAKHSLNIVRCNNVATGAAMGLTSLPGCSDLPQTTAKPEVLPSVPNWPNWQALSALEVALDAPLAPEFAADIPQMALLTIEDGSAEPVAEDLYLEPEINVEPDAAASSTAPDVQPEQTPAASQGTVSSAAFTAGNTLILALGAAAGLAIQLLV